MLLFFCGFFVGFFAGVFALGLFCLSRDEAWERD